MKDENKIDKEFFPNYDEETPIVEPSKKKSIFRKIFKGFGYGSIFVGGGIVFILFSILQFLVITVVGLGMIRWAITEFLKGSVIIGLLVLLIGTPLAIALAHWAFWFLLIFAALSAIIWGIVHLFGFNISFGNTWDIVWFIMKMLILGGMTFIGIAGFIEAIKEKKILGFFKEYWWGILFFCFLFWLFFF